MQRGIAARHEAKGDQRFRVIDGADTFVIRDGSIVMQSMHYTLEDGD